MLYVCTGNICRSAVAQQLLRQRAADRPALRVGSAGTGALEGYGVDGPSALALREIGGDPDGHEARWLTPDLIAEADLILAATTEHRDRVLRIAPTKMRRTFTMREFARLGADVPGATDPAVAEPVVLTVAAMRGQVEPAGPGQDDIGDPFGAGLDVARAMVAEVAATVDVTARLLGLPAPG